MGTSANDASAGHLACSACGFAMAHVVTLPRSAHFPMQSHYRCEACWTVTIVTEGVAVSVEMLSSVSSGMRSARSASRRYPQSAS